MQSNDNEKNRGTHGDSSFMLDGLPSSSENPPDLSVGSVKVQNEVNVTIHARFLYGPDDLEVSQPDLLKSIWEDRVECGAVRVLRASGHAASNSIISYAVEVVPHDDGAENREGETEDRMTTDWKEDYSAEFDRIREARVEMSHYKYGSVRKNYREGNINALATMEKCVDKYRETGNTEYLADAANYLMFEFMYPQVKGAHFRTTDSAESAGIVGISEKEMEEIKREDF